MANKIAKALGYAMMGFGGGLSGQNYIKMYMDSLNEDKEDIKDKMLAGFLKDKGIDISGIGTPSLTGINGSDSLAQNAYQNWLGARGQGQPLSQGLQNLSLQQRIKPSELGLEDTPQSLARLEVSKEVEAQGAKAAELAGRDVLRASMALDTAMDTFADFGKKQLDIFGLRPGQFLGIVDKLTPSEYNEYKDAFLGAGKEAASLVARQLIPGVRSASITEIFSKSAAKLGSTMEANISNTAASLANSFGNALSQNITVVGEDGREIKLQDVTIDPKTGRRISDLPFGEKLNAVNRVKRQFQDTTESNYTDEMYKREPRLFKPETIKKMKNKMDVSSFGLDPNEWEMVR